MKKYREGPKGPLISFAPPGLIEPTNPKPRAYAWLTPAYALGYNLSPLRGDLTFRPLRQTRSHIDNSVAVVDNGRGIPVDQHQHKGMEITLGLAQDVLRNKSPTPPM